MHRGVDRLGQAGVPADLADAVLLVPEDHYPHVAGSLPTGFGIVGRIRPAFRGHDVLAVGALPDAPAERTATTGGTTR